MSETVVLALLAAGQGVTVALIGAVALVLSSTRKHVKAGTSAAEQANEQVSNTHRTNLRHDLDGMADDIRKALGLIGSLHESVGKLWSHTRRQDDRMDDLEQTIDPHDPARSRWAPPNEGEHDDRSHDPPRPVEGRQPEGGGLRDRGRLRRRS